MPEILLSDFDRHAAADGVTGVRVAQLQCVLALAKRAAPF